MKIERIVITPATKTIESFAELHDLVMQIMTMEDGTFQAFFKHAAIRTGLAGLVSEFGRGNTEGAAIADYAERISGKLLIIDAVFKCRREIWVPKFESPQPRTSAQETDQ
jgi:hypothetical protein